MGQILQYVYTHCCGASVGAGSQRVADSKTPGYAMYTLSPLTGLETTIRLWTQYGWPRRLDTISLNGEAIPFGQRVRTHIQSNEKSVG